MVACTSVYPAPFATKPALGLAMTLPTAQPRSRAVAWNHAWVWQLQELPPPAV